MSIPTSTVCRGTTYSRVRRYKLPAGAWSVQVTLHTSSMAAMQDITAELTALPAPDANGYTHVLSLLAQADETAAWPLARLVVKTTFTDTSSPAVILAGTTYTLIVSDVQDAAEADDPLGVIPGDLVAVLRGEQGPAWPSEAVQTAAEQASSDAQAAAGVATTKADAASGSATLADEHRQDAQDAAGVATTKADAASGSATQADQHRQAAQDAAGVATTKAAAASGSATQADQHRQAAQDAAGVATTKATAASDSATLADEHRQDAQDAAGVATTKAAAASDSATLADQHRQAAQDAAGVATTKAVAASDSAVTAVESRDLAHAWATTPTDTPVVPLGADYSALHWAAKSELSQAIAGAFASSAQDAKVAAVAAAAAAVAVVTGGTASLVPAAGKIPIADGAGKIDAGWVDLLPASASAALHRSPNAITAMFIYDTARDSDGGAWVERSQHTTWYSETLSGKWLGRLVSEAAARAISGAATSDYFQLTTDGKPYKLVAVTGVTETARGNKSKFPRIAGLVAETSNLTIYDMTEPGCPIWRRWATSGAMSIGNISSVVTGQGRIYVGGSTGLAMIDLIIDRLTVVNASNVRKQDFLTTTGTANLVVTSGALIASSTVNAVAMTVLPDAPTDIVTGLKVPTIAVATAGGVSVIKHDGTVVNSAATTNSAGIVLSQHWMMVHYGSAGAQIAYAYTPGNLGPSFALSLYQVNQAPDFIGPTTTATRIFNAGRSLFARASTSGTVRFLRQHESVANKGISAAVANTFNTGYMVGDIRRCYLAGTVAKAYTPSVELVLNGGFDTDLSGWSTQVSSNNTATQSGGIAILQVNTYDGGTFGFAQPVATAVGATYLLRVDVLSAGVPNRSTISVGTAAFNSAVSAALDGVTGTGTKTVIFTATTSTSYISLRCWGANQTGTWSFDNVSVKEVIADRSYKSASSLIYGTLTAAPVAAGAQLVAYSGFSGANYLREPYSPDLDFGTGEWSMGVCVVYATAVASIIASRAYSTGPSIVLGTDAAGKLTAAAFDGTTTRSVTTAAAYNNSTLTKVVANYRAGRLALEINGIEVAATSGAPLLTLNNSNAVLTIGNSYDLSAPFPGSITMLKMGATVPTPEQSSWMYERERSMFREGSQVCLPEATTVSDLSYDPQTDKWTVVQAGSESSWVDLTRISTTAPSAGTFSKVESKSGIKLLARATTSPGVDVTWAGAGVREELVRRAEAAAALSRQLQVFDFDAVGFTAAMTINSPTITASSIVGTPYVGMGVTGSGVPTNTVINGINGTSYTLSANCTVTGSNALAQSTFSLAPGWTAVEVISASASKREGTTKDWVRLYDGFRETVRFAVGSVAWVQINARKDS